MLAAGVLAVSYQAVAAALALEDLSVGERLTAFALASYANRAQLAWPAARTASIRAGLSRRQYLVARDRLADRGLIALDHADGRCVARLMFAEEGLSIQREVNPQRFEAVLARSSARGGARVLIAVLAALADSKGLVRGLSSEELADASGLSDRTYRRARHELLAAGVVEIDQPGGGRSRCNRWRVLIQSTDDAVAPVARRRRPQGRGQMPLMAIVRDESRNASPGSTSAGTPVESTRPQAPSSASNPGVNPGQICASGSEKTPAQTPAARVRAGMKSQNQGTSPPDPPEGGQSTLTITERYVTEAGRSRTRSVNVDPTSELTPLSDSDRELWDTAKEWLRQAAGAATHEIWLAALSPIAIGRRDDAVLLAAPPDLHRWVASRHERLFEALSQAVGRPVRLASERELALHATSARATASSAASDLTSRTVRDHQEAI